jgi:3-hydroxyisobutyrate dehydrogenase-like beta-hydroxyacid dehydrogenase
MATIGFIGLGNMGAPTAANLIGAGHHVTGFDFVPRAMEALATKAAMRPHRLPRPPPRATS